MTTITPARAVIIARRRRAAEGLVRRARALDEGGVLPPVTDFTPPGLLEAWNVVETYDPFSRDRQLARAYARALEGGAGIKWGRARALAALKLAMGY